MAPVNVAPDLPRQRVAWGQTLDEQGRIDLGGFAEGTEIDTASGPCPVEHLQPGDLIRTTDQGVLAVQANWAIPEDMAPRTLLRLRATGSISGVTLYALASQCVVMSHWLCPRLFEAEQVLMRLGDLRQPGPADPVARHDRQIYRLELGVTCCIMANNHRCGLLSSRQPLREVPAGQMAGLRLLSADDAQFLQASIGITRPRQRRA